MPSPSRCCIQHDITPLQISKPALPQISTRVLFYSPASKKRGRGYRVSTNRIALAGSDLRSEHVTNSTRKIAMCLVDQYEFRTADVHARSKRASTF